MWALFRPVLRRAAGRVEDAVIDGRQDPPGRLVFRIDVSSKDDDGNGGRAGHLERVCEGLGAGAGGPGVVEYQRVDRFAVRGDRRAEPVRVEVALVRAVERADGAG